MDLHVLPEAFSFARQAPVVTAPGPRDPIATRSHQRQLVGCKDHGSASTLAGAAAVLAAVGCASRRQAGRAERSAVSRSARAKTKKKKSNAAKNEAVLKAMAALEQLNVQEEQASKKKKEKKQEAAKRWKEQNGVKAEDGDTNEKVEAKEDTTEAKAREDASQAKAEEEALQPEAKEEALQTEAEEKAVQAKAEEEDVQAKAEEEDVQAKAEEEDVQANSEKEDVQAKAKEEEEEEEALQTLVEKSTSQAKGSGEQVEEKKDWTSLLDAAATKAKKRAAPEPDMNTVAGALASLGQLSSTMEADPGNADPEEPAEDNFQTITSTVAAEDDDELDEEDYYASKLGVRDWENDDDWAPESDSESSSDEEIVPIKRRRGEADKVDFTLETGSAAGDEEKITLGMKEVAVRLGGYVILQDASWYVSSGQKLALVGANGCGKTTQLRVLTGEIEADEGSVFNPNNARVSVLAQDFVDSLDPEKTLREEMKSAMPDQEELVKELEQLESALQGDNEEADSARLLERYAELQDKVQEYETWSLEDRIERISDQVGFLEEDLERKVGLFSGGFKVRIGLAKIFMTRPDVLLLDEPTNHLDMQSVEWLEDFLTGQNLPIVVVTHDREFMNRVCNRFVETVEGTTYTFDGTYSSYLAERDAKMVKWKQKFDLQVKQIREMRKFIKQNRGKQALAVARAKKKRELEALMASEELLDPPPRFAKAITFTFPSPEMGRRGGGNFGLLAELRDVSHGYGEDEDEPEANLLVNANFSISPGEKIGIVGRNGTGKSTLLRLLAGTEKPSKGGKVTIADERTTSYFAQHQADLLPHNKTAFEIVCDANEVGMFQQDLKDLMKKFRFKGERLNTMVADLSGGERARLAIVRMMLTPSKLLIFDEPTNHLDVPMKETLEFALRNYQGAVVVVSHDRWFLSQSVSKVVEIKDGEVTTYDGDYRFYLDSNREMLREVEGRYTGTHGIIGSVPESEQDRKKKERGGISKHRNRDRAAARRKELYERYAANREWATKLG